MRKLPALLTIGLLVFLMACGGSSSNGGGNNAPTPLKLNMTTASSLVGQNTQFTANVPVSWTVKESNGGKITTDGLYTAPRDIGTYHVVATAKSDATQSASATISISAMFAFLQELQTGSTPYSVTPILATMAPDGKITMQNVMDDTTNKPVDTQMEDVTLSPDGTMAVFTQLTVDVDRNTEYPAIWIANVDGSSVKQLTFPSTPTTYGRDYFPTFTPDGKTVVYTHWSNTTPFETTAIMSVATDGTNQKTIFAGDPLFPTWSIVNPAIWYTAVSPDGTMIAAELGYETDTAAYDGIATMTITGQGLMQLTGDQSTMCPYGGSGGWDQMPAYTDSPDGVVIAFSRLCGIDVPPYETESIMSVNTDGTNLKSLHAPAGLVSSQPRAMADKIAFSSNVDNPATDWFDMYTMDIDGSSLARVTNNTLYDGFSTWWMNGNYPSNATPKVMERAKKISPMQQRLDHIEQIREHRKRR